MAKKVTSTDGLTQDDIWLLEYVAEYNTEAVLAAMDQALARAMEKVGLVAEADVKNYMTKEGIVDTGRLRNSMTHQVQVDGDDYAVIVGTNVEYGPYVEFGIKGRDGRHMLRNTVEKNKAKYRKIVEEEMRGD